MEGTPARSARADHRPSRPRQLPQPVRSSTTLPSTSQYERGRTPVTLGLHDADHVALGIGEEADHQALHHLVWPHHPRRPLAFGPGERLLDVGHLDIEGDVAL